MMNSLKQTLVACTLAFAVSGASAQSAAGLIAVKSSVTAKETLNRVEEIVKQRNLKVFARIDHAAGAQSIGKTLRATELLIFGSPQGGTPMMECAQSSGIDLPLKMLAWEDSAGQTWLGYNDPMFIATRHKADSCPAVANLSKALESLASEATSMKK
jgi:uncharacterized protein (DUF302 family)